MITSRRSQLMVAVTAIAIASTAVAEQGAETKRELQFEVRTVNLRFPSCPSETRFVGDMHITKDRNLPSWIFQISNTSQWEHMSESQRKFITRLQNEYRVTRIGDQRVGNAFSVRSDYTRTPTGTLTYRVHGVSETDVRIMAEALVEWLDEKASKKLKEVQERLEHDRNVMAEAPQELLKLEAEWERLEAQVDDKTEDYAKVNYGIDPKKLPDHVKKSMEQLAHNLKTADFELVGLQARIDLIGKYKTGGKITDQATLIKLNQMLIADEIERAGVFARRSAYEAAFKLAKELYDALAARNEAGARKARSEMRLADAEGDASRMERILADPPPEMRPVEVYKNEVTIHPVGH
ncbi:MAG: hypothetical protein ACYSWQ_01865 [Planctomycetota bacterium]